MGPGPLDKIAVGHTPDRAPPAWNRTRFQREAALHGGELRGSPLPDPPARWKTRSGVRAGVCCPGARTAPARHLHDCHSPSPREAMQGHAPTVLLTMMDYFRSSPCLCLQSEALLHEHTVLWPIPLTLRDGLLHTRGPCDLLQLRYSFPPQMSRENSKETQGI